MAVQQRKKRRLLLQSGCGEVELSLWRMKSGVASRLGKRREEREEEAESGKGERCEQNLSR